MEGEHIEHFNFRGYIWRSRTTGKVGVYAFPCNPETPNKQEDWQLKIPLQDGREVTMTNFIANIMTALTTLIEGDKTAKVSKKKPFTFDNFGDD